MKLYNTTMGIYLLPVKYTIYKYIIGNMENKYKYVFITSEIY